jgi:glycosyltransferase involved in cell wall biosynthesis
MRVLYDGWPLVRNPISPGSLHLLAILENLPDDIDPIVAFPESVPMWMGDIPAEIRPTPDTPSGRLRWEQFRIPLLARKLKVNILHLTAPAAPVFSGLSTLISPSGFGAGIEDWSGVRHSSTDSIHFLTRLRLSLAQGGMVQVKEILWPLDLPGSELSGKLATLPPIVPLDFIPRAAGQLQPSDNKAISFADRFEKLGLPESFFLYHGPGDRRNLEQLLQAWKWAAAAIGASYPLVVIGLTHQAKKIFSSLVEEYDIGDNQRVLPDVKPDLLPNLYQGCTAVFHSAPASPWCGPVRLALACGKPLVASESLLTDAIAGPAAYLVDEEDARALGAALVTVVVEEQVAESLSAAAIKRSANWLFPGFGEQLLERYHKVVAESG